VPAPHSARHTAEVIEANMQAEENSRAVRELLERVRRPAAEAEATGAATPGGAGQQQQQGHQGPGSD
jgi:hypothetical protein